MIRFSSFVVAFIATLVFASSSLVSSHAFALTDAEAISSALVAHGYACTSAQTSLRCRGPLNAYSQPVNFYIPNAFSRSLTFALAFHFHGFWTRPEFNPFSKVNGDYGSYLAASGKNAILVVPESTGAEATYTKDLNTAAKADAFFKNVQGLLRAAGVSADDSTPRVLSGHSGAYVLLGLMGDWAKARTVPALLSVRGLGLFDSAYGFRQGLVSFLETMRSSGASAYFSAFNPSNSAGKNQTNLDLEKTLGPAKMSGGHADILFLKNNSLAHMEFMRGYMTEFFNFSL